MTVRLTDRQADVQIIWEGGATNEFVLALNKTGGHFRATDEDTVALVRRLAERYDDTTIAPILSKQRSQDRHRAGVQPQPGLLAAQHSRDPGLRAGRRCHTRPTMMERGHRSIRPSGSSASTRAPSIAGSRRLHHGEQLTPGGPWHLRITDELRRPASFPRCPTAGCRLDQAAKALGVARQTVLHKVQRGELEAVHVNRGKRKGLRIKVPGHALDCSRQPE